MIKEALKEQAEALMTFGSGLLHFFVYRNGQAYVPVKHDLPMGPKKQCFANTTRFIMSEPVKTKYRYCEGFAVRHSLGLLMEHAWLVDNLGNAYDLTWDDAHECEYFGIVFDKAIVMREINRNKVYGLLCQHMYNTRLMEEFDISLMEEWKEESAKRKAKFEQFTINKEK